MSIKYYNPELETWISYTSNYATGIRIIDTDGNYIHTDGETGAITRATTVEDALKMIARNMTTLEERVEWIYENGTIGGGPGGGSLLPNLKLIEPASTVDTQDYASIDVSTDEELTVTFSFQSPNIGMGTAYYLISGDRSLRDSARVSQGIISYKFGKFETGNYNITIYVVDAAGLFSNTLSINIRAGGLEITTNFNDALDFTLDEHIVVDYEVSTVSRSPIEMRFQVDQTITTRTLEKGGAYQWEIGQLRSPGVHRATISATSGDFTSNVITFNLIVASPDSMFIASDFDKTTSLQGRDLTIRYRAAMAGETRALIHKWINGVKQPLDTVFIGTGNYLYWKLGDSLEPGSYVFELQASTTDERSYSEKLRFEVDVINQDFARIYPIKDDYLLAYFMADNKSSMSETKNVWEDRSGKNVSCTLHNFNHVTNGWDGYALNFSGRSYAEIDLSPWASNITNGFTFDIYYKTENIGDLDAKVLWMKNSSTPYQGFYIDTQRCNMVSGSSKTIETFLEDSSDKENWQHATFVVNRKRNLMEIFINGVLTQSILLSKTESFRFDGKIYLGARNNEGEMDQHGKCSIRAIHVYGRALEDEEIINNYISCLAYPEVQEKVYRLNYDDRQIPRLDITGDLTGIEASTSVTKEVSLDLLNYQDMERGFNLSNCLISMQGTSSTLYPVINYTINLIENGQNFYFSPKEGWIPECRFTLKANYIDSSSANNLSNARFFGDMMNEYHPYPSQLKNPDCRSTVDGFPIQLYVNGEYAGLYTFNVDRYANRTLGFEPLTQGEADNCMAYEVSANTNTGAGAFMTQGDDAATWNMAKREFKYRYHYAGKNNAVTKDPEDGNAEVLADGTYHKDLLELIKWTSDSDNSTFRGELASHWSLDHLIDYFLFVYVVGLVD
ncbi:MAG: CotH kinase family protein [Turicibacter sp.]|nr:CotH kinase family protein [Turicibacter sp.]